MQHQTSEVQELAADVLRMLRELMASVDAGELTCSAATRHRLEGVSLALGVVAEQPVSTLADVA